MKSVTEGNGGCQTLFRKSVKFLNRSKISKPTSGASEIVKTGAIESLVAIAMSEKSAKMFLIWHMGKVPQFQMIFVK